MNVSKNICISLFLLLVMCIGISYTNVTPHNSVSIICLDPLLSEHEQEKIVALLEPTIHTGTVQSFQELLQQQIPELKEISIWHSPRGGKKIYVGSHAPQVTINKDKVLNQAGSVLAKDVYDAHLVDQLIDVKVPTLAQAPDLLTFIQQLSSELYERFTITWLNSSQIMLQEKQHPDFVVECDNISDLTAKAVERCTHVYQLMKDSRKLSKKAEHVVTDMRFENQIVAYFKEGAYG